MKKRERTIQRSIAWPESMYAAIERQAEKLNIPVAAYIRYATEKQLQADGENVQDTLMWGGYRHASEQGSETEPGQVLALPAAV